MSELITYALATFMSLFAIINPLGNVPFFVAVTQGYTRDEKRNVATKTLIVATLTLFIFGIFGKYIFTLFGITIPAFRLAGGILLFKIGFDMLHGKRSHTKRTEEEKQEALEKESVGIVPLGVPMFAGPGSISTIMLFVSSHPTVPKIGIIFGSVVLTMIIGYILLRNANRIFDRIGRAGTMAFSRIMGLIIAAIAVEFIISGIRSILTEWMPLFLNTQ
ncbi:MAG: hypothetical protein CVT48_02490 [Thermoplasmata archaeon HGW-Thermoplasmata-1]|nr:MAG: hypothetical protein CVT48_02490 [Thermoplasmata archaeon HGW-Thermoplasmata-1]